MVQAGRRRTVYSGTAVRHVSIVINHQQHKTGPSEAGASLQVMVTGTKVTIPSHQEVYTMHS